jgi:NAD(P)-dependent dehydrogenase (short-subunit alcohol dehydrogenase family)
VTGRLDGRVAIITGAAGVLGTASVRAMLDEGAYVLGVDRDAGALKVLTGSLDHADRLRTSVVDVSSEPDVDRAVRTAVGEFGGLDIMFNNAGVVGLEHLKDLFNLDVETWDLTMDVNVKGVMLGCKHAAPAMIDRGGGSIINTSSAAAFHGNVVNIAYGTSKAAVIALTRYVAAALGEHRIRCNAIAPGIHISEDVLENLPAVEGEYSRERLDRLRDECMIPRLGTPDDIAKAVVFLASDDAGYITAQVLSVSGGLTEHTVLYHEQRRGRSVYVTADDDAGR